MYAVVLKKTRKTSKRMLFGPNLHKKCVITGHAQNEKQYFRQKQQKQIMSYQKLFILLKYHKNVLAEL